MDESPPNTGTALLSDAASFISVRGLTKSFNDTGVKIEILANADFDLAGGETVAVVGASGIGKSTFLHLLGLLDTPDEGRLSFNGQNVLELSADRLARFRNASIGFVFQFHHLLPEFTALENTMMPGLIRGVSKSEAARGAEAILVRVGLKDRLGHRLGELSGGEQQRVALARALVQHPLLLLADEPTGNLDSKNSRRIHELLCELNRELSMTMVVVTHNEELAALMSRRVTIRNGRLVSV